jgi:predicted transcriptional regulator
MHLAGISTQAERVNERRQLVKELFGRGLSQGEIARELGIDQTIVRDDRRALGLPSAKDLYAQREEEVSRLYLDEKLGQAVIAQRLGLTESQVGHVIHKLGIGRERGRGSLTTKAAKAAERREQVRELYTGEGFSAREIAGMIGWSESAVSADIKAMGLARRAVSRRFANPNIISNAMDQMEAMATVVLDQSTGLVDDEQVARWAKQAAKVRRALNHVRKYQTTNNQGDNG